MIFYSPINCGFYDSRLHGERTLHIPDPDWQRPQLPITLQPGEASPDGSTTNETDEPITLDVPDEQAEHPLIEVPNPDCLVPADAIEITPELHAELLAGNAQGQHIVTDENGQPALQAPPPLTAEQLAAEALAQRTRQLQVAAQMIAPLQDAVDLGDATEAEQTALLEWKRYRVALNRIEQQPSYPNTIDWPVAPA